MSQKTVGPFPPPLPSVGEADTIREIDHLDAEQMRSARACGAFLPVGPHHAHFCTRRSGHPGDHLAGDGRRIVSRWPQFKAETGAQGPPVLVGADPLEPQEVDPKVEREDFMRAWQQHFGGLILPRFFDSARESEREEELERRRFNLAAELYVHGPSEASDVPTPALCAKEALRYADDLILEHLGTLDKFLDRVRESAKENADA